MLPGAEPMKADNPGKAKGNSFLGKLLATGEEALKILE
jgi:hypothetical protein